MLISHGMNCSVATAPKSATSSHRKDSGHHELPASALPAPGRKLSPKLMTGAALFAAVTVGSLFLLGWLPRQQRARLLASESDRIKNSLLTVRVIQPKPAPLRSVVTLPGDVQPMEDTTIYPRTTGYVKRLLVDIGDEVTAGQLIAEIDTPDIKAQLQESEAALEESKSSLERTKATVNLATITNKRTKTLVARKSSSQQDLDESENKLAESIATMRLNEATIESNKARVQHMRELMSFAEVRAPFSGTVVARLVDTGKLVTSGNGTGQALFQLARTNPVRVFVNVPQTFAPGVSVGLKATITTRELPGRKFIGTVKRTPRAIDPVTRTLLTEIHVPNEDRALLTGSYAQVRMEVERPNQPLRIPATALIFNAAGTQVAVVSPDRKVQFRAIEVAEDLGSEISVASGVTAGDQVITNPGDRLSDGIEVSVTTAKP